MRKFTQSVRTKRLIVFENRFFVMSLNIVVVSILISTFDIKCMS